MDALDLRSTEIVDGQMDGDVFSGDVTFALEFGRQGHRTRTTTKQAQVLLFLPLDRFLPGKNRGERTGNKERERGGTGREEGGTGREEKGTGR